MESKNPPKTTSGSNSEPSTIAADPTSWSATESGTQARRHLNTRAGERAEGEGAPMLPRGPMVLKH